MSDGEHGLPAALKRGVEQASGLSMDDVQAHRSSSMPAKLQGLAYANGAGIHLDRGQERIRHAVDIVDTAADDHGALEREAATMRACVPGSPLQSAGSNLKERQAEQGNDKR